MASPSIPARSRAEGCPPAEKVFLTERNDRLWYAHETTTTYGRKRPFFRIYLSTISPGNDHRDTKIHRSSAIPGKDLRPCCPKLRQLDAQVIQLRDVVVQDQVLLVRSHPSSVAADHVLRPRPGRV